MFPKIGPVASPVATPDSSAPAQVKAPAAPFKLFFGTGNLTPNAEFRSGARISSRNDKPLFAVSAPAKTDVISAFQRAMIERGRQAQTGIGQRIMAELAALQPQEGAEDTNPFAENNGEAAPSDESQASEHAEVAQAESDSPFG